MTGMDPAALDRHITGNYGEDQLIEHGPRLVTDPATVPEMEVLRAWAHANGSPLVAAEVDGIADCLLAAYESGTAPVSVWDMREELGLCQAGHGHWGGHCAEHGCPEETP